MIFYILLLLLYITPFNDGFKDYNVKSINLTDHESIMSFEAVKVHNKYTFQLIINKDVKISISQAIFIEQINMTGWGFLSVTTSNNFPDEWQAYYAGVVEAIITKPLIKAQISNTYPNYCSSMTTFCKNLKQYFTNNIESMIFKSRNQGGYWKMVRLMLWQIKGMQDGYDGKWKNDSTDINENLLLELQNQVFELFLIQADGDLSALAQILGGSDYHSSFPGHKIIGDGSCSAFIKYFMGDIFVSHVTWSPYQIMLRITKFYNFPYRLNYNENNSPLIPGQNISFSSYPGQITSLDDYYITSGGLITTETTIGNYNKSLWIQLKNQSSNIILEYIRVQVSNRLSKSGSEWSFNFQMHNSGTYNNQWMIVNTNLMEGHRYGMKIPDGVLYVAEQIPNLIIYKDVTDYLRTSYWASYNIPFYPLIYKKAGFHEMAAKYGDFFTIDRNPRALIFKREAHKVIDGLSLMKLMRYNDYKHDPLSRCACQPPYSGENAISCRSDLNPENGTYPFEALGYRLHGGTDMKATNLYLAKLMHFIGISSPTYDQQPFFDWRNIKDKSVNHNLHPLVWKFDPIITPFP